MNSRRRRASCCAVRAFAAWNTRATRFATSCARSGSEAVNPMSMTSVFSRGRTSSRPVRLLMVFSRPTTYSVPFSWPGGAATVNLTPSSSTAAP